MKKLDEKLSLLRMAQAFGVEPAPFLLEEIKELQAKENQKLKQQQELKQRVHTASQTLFEAPKAYVRPSTYTDGAHIPANLPDLYQPASHNAVPKNQRCDNCEYYVAETKKCTRWNNAVVRANYWCAKWEKIEKKDLKEEVLITSRPQSVPDQMAQYITRNPIKETVISQGDPVLLDPTNNLQLKVKQLEKWVSKIAATGPGSGSAWLWDLYDVDSGIKTTSVDTQILSYDGALNKWTNKNQLQVDNTSITVSGGVISAQAYYGSFYSTQNLTSLTTSAQTLRINNVDQNNNGVNLNTSTGVFTLVHPGTYNVAFSIQCKNTDTGSADHDVYVWLRQNGADVALTNSIITVPAGHGSLQGYVIAAWNLFLRTTAANETFELRWWTDGPTKVTLETVPAQAATAVTPAMPASPAVILTVNGIKLT
jgi:hypothetical protein